MELQAEEKRILEQVYGHQIANSIGYNPNQIKEVRELTTDETKFFDRTALIAPNFAVQTLYKVKGNITPLIFNRVVRNMIKEDENFRANYCNVGKRTVKVILVNRKNPPEIVYRNLNQLYGEELDEMLTKIMEADRRVDFDIKLGNLIRFAVFRTGENENAVLVTISQLLVNFFDSKNFFRAVLENTPYKKIEIPQTNLSMPQVEGPAREYWANFLQNLPPPSIIPYSKKFSGIYKEKIYRLKISADIFSDLRARAQSNKAMLMTILQSAWGFFLQVTNHSSEVMFCQLTSNAKSAMNLSVIPVRMKISGELTVEKIINQQFRQLVVSQPYSFFDWNNLDNLPLGREKIFDHFLNFLDFRTNQETYSEEFAEPDGKFVTRNSWGMHGMKLGVHFQYTQSNLSVTFIYDENQFSFNAGENLARTYGLILKQMLVYWHAPFKNFAEHLQEQIAADKESTEKIARDTKNKIIIDFISRNSILHDEGTGTVYLYAENSDLVTCFEGDRIYGDILEENLVFVVEGKLARNVDTGDGWFNALDIISAGGWINETVFLQERRLKISAEVLTEKATLMLIPFTRMENILRGHPEIAKPILKHILRQMEKYQMLWLQS